MAQTLTTLPRPTLPSSSRRPSHDAQAYSSNLYGATWTMKFSKDGKYLASAGQFCNVYVWRVLDETAQDGENSIDVFEDMHYREYRGHLADVLDISWSKASVYVCKRDETMSLMQPIIEQLYCFSIYGQDCTTMACL